ncbi:MAG: 2-hydroxyacyl-CoA dehydratase family protein [Deltaproteobacteria bacterium]
MSKKLIGFTCAYTPLAIISAGGFRPYRIFSNNNELPEQAGQILHENLCPHVKLVLDRAMAGDIPDEMGGVIFMNSCDTMRRLSDAWSVVRPQDKTLQLDLPLCADKLSIDFFAQELVRLSEFLASWGGSQITEETIRESICRYNSFADDLSKARLLLKQGKLKGGSVALQKLYISGATEPLEIAHEKLSTLLNALVPDNPQNKKKIFLVGNVMPLPEFFSFFESCGVQIIAEDMCTGSRMFPHIPITADGADIFHQLAKGILSQQPCARTFCPDQVGSFANDVVTQAKQSGADAVIVHTMKFCDPYLARLPSVRSAMKEAEIPMLFLEGDCSLRSMGQHKTRIEAFVETL